MRTNNSATNAAEFRTAIVAAWGGVERWRDDAEWSLSSGADLGRERLRVVFAEDFPTRCREQEFYFDATGGLVRHDYTARAFGDFARAANIPIETSSADGFRWVRRRAVYPRAAYARGIRAPVLVDVEVPEFRVFMR